MKMINGREVMVLTHDNLFHADEVCAVALLKHFLHVDVNLTRTRDRRKVEKAINDRRVFVIDLGYKYDADMRCFDHHQDRDMPASNILVFEWLVKANHISKKLSDQLRPFLEGISDIDTNHDYALNTWRTFNSDDKYRNISTIIGGFNGDPTQDTQQYLAFYQALEVMRKILANEVRNAKQRLREEEILKDAELINGRVLLMEEYCSIWKDKRKNAYTMAIMPHPQGWQVLTRDSDNFPLPDSDLEELVFIHANRFIAVFKTREAAVEYAILEL